MIEITGNSLKYINKEKNGDHLLYENIDQHLLLAVVADGVSRQPCDWKASQTACQELIRQFKVLYELPLADRLKASMIHANESVIAESGSCQLMSTTLSVLCLHTQNQQGYFGNVGDSRIYRVRNKNIDQLTTDDTLKQTKTIMTDIGRRTVDASVLTKNLGMDSSFLDMSVTPFQSQAGDLYILATDGFYDARVAFPSHMITLAENNPLETAFQACFKKYSLLAGDDMTAIVIRINDH